MTRPSNISSTTFNGLALLLLTYNSALVINQHGFYLKNGK